jgi:signal peptidase II
MTRRATRLLALLCLVGVIGCDHATKVTAKAALEGAQPLNLVSGVLDLRYAENRDTAFSALRWLHIAGKEQLLLALASLGFVALLVAWWRRRGAGRIEQAGYALVAAGAIGNIADRATRGYVVDFIHLAHWPIFNVADVAICVGAGLIALARARVVRRMESNVGLARSLRD